MPSEFVTIELERRDICLTAKKQKKSGASTAKIGLRSRQYALKSARKSRAQFAVSLFKPYLKVFLSYRLKNWVECVVPKITPLNIKHHSAAHLV